MKLKQTKGSWIVRMRCSVDKDVVCENCTEEEATNNPFDHAIDEVEVGQNDYDVLSVRPNE